MKKIYKSRHSILLVLCIVFNCSLQAQNFKVVDINKTTNSNPFNFQYTTNNIFAVYNGDFYFTADDGIHGKELLKSDGTGAGTQLVSDITPGAASTMITDIVASGNYLYFIVTDNYYTGTVWMSDGTSAGTKQVSNLAAAFGGGFITSMTDVNGTLNFFYIYSDFNGQHMELWKTDVTGTSAVRVAALNGIPIQTAVVNNKLFFDCPDYVSGLGDELFISDGTAAGTHIVADLNPNPYGGSNPIHLTPLNGLLYFAADDGNGNKLWVSDGTSSGTHMVQNTYNILLGSDAGYGNDPFAIINSTLYFQGAFVDNATSTSTGYELCSYDASNPSANVILVKDILNGSASSFPTNISNINGILFFSAVSGNTNLQLWKSDGTSTGTILVKDMDTGQQNYFYGFNNLNGTLLFTYQNNSLGGELWMSDGTAGGTILVKDIAAGSISSSPSMLTYYNGQFVFSATGPEGNELWRTDGSTAGTYLVKDINTTSRQWFRPF